MIVGASQVDITPPVGVELCGFAARSHPSTAVLDPLFCRALWLDDGREKLLWLHADLIGLPRGTVADLRRWAREELGVAPSRVMVSATHTHSGPTTVGLIGCGRADAGYLRHLPERLREAAAAAAASTERCEAAAVEARCELSIDRRGGPSAHTDPRVGAVAFRRADGTLKAVLVNYAMHPVCLSGGQISADWPGAAAEALSQWLPGGPIAMVTVGACGNVNPPPPRDSVEHMRRVGRTVAQSVAGDLEAAAGRSPASPAPLRVARTTEAMPLETWTAQQIDRYADEMLPRFAGEEAFDRNARLAIGTWRESMKRRAEGAAGGADHAPVELFAAAIGGAVFLGVGAEIFSRFTERLRAAASRPVYTVSCANGLAGYVATEAAYDEGGYEVETAFLFYNAFRPRRGSLEALANRAAHLAAAVGA